MNPYYCYNPTVNEMGLSKTAYKLYHILAQFVENKTRECYLRKNTLAQKIGRTERQTQRLIRELEQKGVLKTTYRYNYKGEQISNLYTLLDKEDESVRMSTASSFTQKENSASAKQEDLDGTAMKVFFYIRNHTNKSGKSFLCYRTIAQALSLSCRTVQRTVKELVKVGIIDFKRSFGKVSTFIFRRNKERKWEIDTCERKEQNAIFTGKVLSIIGKIFSMRI